MLIAFMARVITFLVFLMPACRLKLTLLRWLGHSIGIDVRIGPCVVDDVKRFELGDGAGIGGGNTFRDLDLVTLGKGASVGHWNWITCAPGLVTGDGDQGTLRLADHATVVSRHYIDCTGGVFLDEYSVLGGLRSVLLTHQADYRTSTLTVDRISIGAYSLVNACNNLVQGATVPARCITTMGAVILPGLTAENRLYGGVPARDLKAVEGRWFDRSEARLES